jgi:nicotinate-nucleotide adenylyltransferase
VTRRIGILGGTFDPPHIGHLWLAALARDALDLERVLVIPARRPPHKRSRSSMTPAEVRVEMARAAIAEDAGLELSLIEMERSGPSYTVDSVEALLERYAEQARLTLLMAADSLVQIDTWREPDRLLSLVDWAVAPRGGAELPTREAIRERFGSAARRIHYLDGPAIDLSSSEIRRRVAAGQTIRYLVPRDVERLIAERRLYRRSR